MTVQSNIDARGITFGANSSSPTIERMRITQTGNVGISTTTPIAKLDVNGTISASDAIQVSGSTLTCSSAIKGAIRYSNTSSTVEYCNSTAWTSLGPSDTTPVSFRVSKITSSQSLAHATGSRVTFNNETFDTNNNFASDRFTVTVPGKYLLNAQIGIDGTTALREAWVSIYKNSVQVSSGLRVPTGTMYNVYPNVVAVLDAAAGDYFEVYAYQDSTGSVAQNILAVDSRTYFSGALLGPQAGGSGGSATPAGSTADVQFNNAGALAADTGNFTYASGLLKAPTVSATSLYSQYASVTTIYNPGSFSGNTIAANSVSSTAVSATTISGTLIQVGTGAGASCDAARKGSLRYSTTSSTVEYCNSTAWTSLGPSDTVPVAFSVTKGGTNQTVTTNVATVLTWSTELFDTNNNFSSNTFTATVPGKYFVSAAGTCTDSTGYCITYINKNAVVILQGRANSTSGNKSAPVSGIVDLNVGDQLTVTVYNAGGTTISGINNETFFTGAIISPQSGGGGGATPAGSTGDIQFNNAGALAADTGQLFWDATNNRLGIGTGAPSYPLEVNGYAAATNFYQSSDRRLKDHIVPIEAGLSVVERLRPVSFRWKKDGRDAVGLIAQDIVKVIPTAVTSNTEGMYSVDYTQATPYLIRSVQELNAAYRELSTINLKLGDENDDLRENNRRLEERLLRVEQLLQSKGRDAHREVRTH